MKGVDCSDCGGDGYTALGGVCPSCAGTGRKPKAPRKSRGAMTSLEDRAAA